MSKKKNNNNKPKQQNEINEVKYEAPALEKEEEMPEMEDEFEGYIPPKNRNVIIGWFITIGAVVAFILLMIIINGGNKSIEQDPTTPVIALESTTAGENPESTGISESQSTTEDATSTGTVTDKGETSLESKTDDTKKSETSSESASKQTTQTTQTKQTTQITQAVNPPKSVEKGTPFANHGRLSVKGANLVDKNGKTYQLRGVSTHGIQWFPEFVNEASFKTLRDEWGCNVVRLAMYTAENGYCNGNREAIKATVKKGVEAATKLGMYVIIDWHVLNDPASNQNESVAFFNEMSALYKGYGNVLYEICNEPNGGCFLNSWSSIKSYAGAVIPAIKKNDPNAIVIVGTPTWSQEVDKPAADPITGYSNIMYTIHFYAATHKEGLRNNMVNAIQKGLPVICTEFGICDASGNGACDENEANKWISTMDKYNVSYCIWNLANKNESSSLIKESCKKTSNWTMNELNQEGQWFVKMMKGSGADIGKNPQTQPQQTQPQQTQPKQTQPQQTQPKQTQAQAVKATDKNCKVTTKTNYQEGNADWPGQGQINIDIENTGNAPIGEWNLELTFDKSLVISGSWNGTMKSSGNTVTITSTGRIEPHGIFNGIGFYYSGNAKLISIKIK